MVRFSQTSCHMGVLYTHCVVFIYRIWYDHPLRECPVSTSNQPKKLGVGYPLVIWPENGKPNMCRWYVLPKMMEHKGCPLPWVSCNDLELVSTQKPDYDHTEIDHGFLFFGHTTQRPFQDPRLEVPTIYIRPIFQAYVREYPHKIWPYTVQYLHFRILKFPLIPLCFRLALCWSGYIASSTLMSYDYFFWGHSITWACQVPQTLSPCQTCPHVRHVHLTNFFTKCQVFTNCGLKLSKISTHCCPFPHLLLTNVGRTTWSFH
jgi:hypothetical protein